MRICTKKIYCAHCGKLVRCKEQKNGATVKVTCNSCGKTLYIWDGASWRPVSEAA